MKKSDRILHVRAFLSQFDALERKDGTDAVGWIALKFSCSREQAEKWIREAEEPSMTARLDPAHVRYWITRIGPDEFTGREARETFWGGRQWSRNRAGADNECARLNAQSRERGRPHRYEVESEHVATQIVHEFKLRL